MRVDKKPHKHGMHVTLNDAFRRKYTIREVNAMVEGVVKQEEKSYRFLRFKFHYVKVITEDKDIIKGGGLYLAGKHILTIALCNNLWIDENGLPYNFKPYEGTFYLRRLAISLF